MTTCEKLGYRVGDKFKVLGVNCTFSKGSIIELVKDDGSITPYFRLLEGACDSLEGKGYLPLSFVKKLEDNTKEEYINLLKMNIHKLKAVAELSLMSATSDKSCSECFYKEMREILDNIKMEVE